MFEEGSSTSALSTQPEQRQHIHPNGPRAQKLKQILQKSLSETLLSYSFEKVSQCFPKLAENHSDALKSAHEQMTRFLRSSCEEEFSNILKKRHVLEKLNEFDELINASKKRNEIGMQTVEQIHYINPATILRAKTVPIKEEELRCLKEEFMKIQRENNSYMAELAINKSRLEALSKTTREITSEFKKAVDLASQIPVEEMQDVIDAIIKM
ncbi:hypothetical protein G9A89_015945 [Geosiphon pyriformis]|nr:hypothetical protein G9A89_015945 [Geosiphon pyriformis]